MSNILNKIQVQGNPTVTYDLLGSAIPCYGPYVDQSTGHITDLYADYEQLIFIHDKIENALYIDLYTGQLYSYTQNAHHGGIPVPADYWFIPVSVDSPIITCDGYQYSEHGGTIINLYLAGTSSTPVPKNENYLYIEIHDNVIYRYNSTTNRFEQIGNDDYCVQGEVSLDRTQITFDRPLVTTETTRDYVVDFFISDGSNYSSVETTVSNTIVLTFDTPLEAGVSAWATFKLMTPSITA